MNRFLHRLVPTFVLLAAAGLNATASFAGGPAAAAAPPSEAAITERTDRLMVRLRALESGVAGPSSSVTGTATDIATRVAQLAGRTGLAAQRLRGMSGNAQVLQLSRLYGRAEAAALARRLAQDPDVLWAEPDLRMVPLRVPNDPSYASQWHYHEAAGGINLPAAWDRTTGSADIVVGVLDTGITSHPEFTGRLVAGYDFIANVEMAQDGDGRDSDPSDPGDFNCEGRGNGSSWHGTHVAGTIGAASNNGVGVAGVNWGSRIQPLRVLGRCGGYSSDIIDAMRWGAGIAVAGLPANTTPARVLNLSLGGSGSCGNGFQNAINDVVARGTVVVVSAGNSGTDASGASPANCNNILTVGATTRNGGRASFSNYGSAVAVSAPGAGILSTLNSGGTTPGSPGYASYSGTSMSAPHVAGVVSLMLSANPALTAAQAMVAVKSSARAFPTGTGADCTVALCGAGIVDAAAALAATAPAEPPPPSRSNWALPANGGVATASSAYSAYPPSGTNDGDRKGTNWAAGGGWNDSTVNTWGDWLQVDFGATRTVAEINVVTVQDNYWAPLEPGEGLTFTNYGITDFEVQYWTGTAWQTVPGGSVTGNNRVLRRFIFTPLQTSRIRVLVLNGLAGYSRITELEAFNVAATATSVNHAFAGNGGVALSSSPRSPAYPAEAVINGDRRGLNWGAGGGWNDHSENVFPDSVQVNFAAAKAISEIDVYTLQDAYTAPQEPTETMTFGQWGITAFDVQAWNGSAWVTVPGGSVTGNDKVWRKFTFPAVTTNSIRVVVNAALGSYSRITEIEAWGAP